MRPFSQEFLILLILGQVQAQPAHHFDLNLENVQGKVQGRYRILPIGGSPGPWQSLPELRQGTNRLSLPTERIEVEVFQDQILSSLRGRREIAASEDYPQIKLERHWEGPRLMALMLLVGAGGLMMVRRSQRRMRTEISHQMEPLIRSDGKLPNRKAGRYRLTGELGRGGMGVVYKGESEDGIPVAIKVPAPHLIAQTDFRQRFMREIRLGIELKHPRLVQVLELPPEEEPFVVMEFVQGTPLNEMPIQPWAIELKNCLALAEQTLEVLEYIHSKGVIHRDLKPSNLIIQADKSIKLMDFGIAHSVDGTRITGADHVLGTPIYMSPEQVIGQPIHPSADIYALGLILYERLLPGLPFPSDVMDLMRWKATQSLPPLSTQGCPVSPEMDEFIQRMVASSPQERFQTATSALAVVRRLRHSGLGKSSSY